MAGQMGMEKPFYNDRPMVHHDYYEYAIISLYTTSIGYQNMERGITMCIYSISWSLKTSGQYGMAGQMGMEDPFCNDRPMVHHDNYEYAVISLYTTSIGYQNMERGITMCIYSISWSLIPPGQYGMAGQMGMEDPFYNDRPMILQDYYKYANLFLVYNKYCVVRYGTMHNHVHIFNIMEFNTTRSVWNGRSNGNGRPIL